MELLLGYLLSASMRSKCFDGGCVFSFPNGVPLVSTASFHSRVGHPSPKETPIPSYTLLVSIIHYSTNSIFSVVVRCGGFRALYGWLGDVWERVRAHKLPRAGPPDWRAAGGRVYVEELLCVLARVPISVDMLRETVRISFDSTPWMA